MFITAGLIGVLVAIAVLCARTWFYETISDFDADLQVSRQDHVTKPAKPFSEYDRLIEDYLGNHTRITAASFNATLKQATDPWLSRGASVLIQVLNNTIYVGRQHYTTPLPWDKLRYHHILDRLLKIMPLPDVEFILNTHDCPLRALPVSPIFSITRCIGMNVLPVPQWFAWRDGSFENWDSKMVSYCETAEATVWGEKQKKAIFRGNVRPSVLQHVNGRLQFVNVTEETYKQLGRTKLYILGQIRPDLLDVGLYGKGLHTGRSIIDLLDYEFKPPISMLHQAQQFRYVLYAEGACGWADRLKVLLASGMLVLMQETPCVEHFQKLLQPWVHYVPINNDFSDLLDRIEWANANEETVREIVHNAQEFALHYNSQRGWDYYLENLLRRYAELQEYTPNRRQGTQKYLKACKCPNRRDLICDDWTSFQMG
ncbi:Glycosyltransferase, family GT90 [Paramicrosporidium saccamoebae]|uniref:Glycosyltransferase, family GT90 n=1 Tax=Paramicrosporidium saccamoebae TaxID=1246581 RepID=A0A2H9TF82_9FUNG|nr:Glycosyltransferase, family GT90 [Paramicrosporidium saccamoebae]